MPEKGSIFLDYIAARTIETKTTLKNLVRLFGEEVDITVRTNAGLKPLTPFLLATLENSEVYGIEIEHESHVIISLVAP